MNLDLDAIGHYLGAGFVLIVVIAVALYTAGKVLRSDRTYSQLISTLEKQLDLANKRADAAEARTEVRLHQFADDARRERDDLRHQIEDLRRELQTYTMRRDQ